MASPMSMALSLMPGAIWLKCRTPANLLILQATAERFSHPWCAHLFPLPRADCLQNQGTEELCACVSVRALVPDQLNPKPDSRNGHGDGDERHLTQENTCHATRHSSYPISVRSDCGGRREARD